MDFSNVPLRVELAVQPTAPQDRLPKRAVSAAPETALPVLAVAPPRLPGPIKGLGIAPLDLFQVGDNDEIPPPPEPPRKAAALMVIAYIPPAPEALATLAREAHATPAPEAHATPAPEAQANPAPQASADATAKATETVAPEPLTPQTAEAESSAAPQPRALQSAALPPSLPHLMLAFDQPSASRTVDIRS